MKSKSPLLPFILQAIEGWKHRLPNLSNRCLVLAIAGESGSGKTTLAEGLQEFFRLQDVPSIILHQDDYFHLPPAQNHAAREADLNHVGPQEVRLDWMDDQLCMLKSGSASVLEMPRMNWDTDQEERMHQDIKGVRVVIVEGTYVLRLRHPDFRIFLSSTFQETYANRVSRNREAITPFIERVLAIESEIIQQQAALADLVLGAQFQDLLSQAQT